MKSLGIILFFLTLSLANANTCATFFHGELKYNFHDPRLQGSKNLLLGEGLAGRVFLRFDPKSAEYVVVKIYKFAPEEATSQFNNDLNVFEILKSLVHLPFALPKVQNIAKGTMQLSYHPGRTIEDLFYDTKNSSEFREELHDRYVQALRAVIKELEGVGFSTNVKRDTLPRIVFQKGRTQIILKPDNFIVNPETLEFTLIDPS